MTEEFKYFEGNDDYLNQMLRKFPDYEVYQITPITKKLPQLSKEWIKFWRDLGRSIQTEYTTLSIILKRKSNE